MKKISARVLLVMYILCLIWLVLFKLHFNIWEALHQHHKSLNLIPFAAPKMHHGRVIYSEMVLNCLLFIPFGLLLNVHFKKTGFVSKFACILAFSLSAELSQYMLAIGATDITDVITNTFGGFLGLIMYAVCEKFIKTQVLDTTITIVGLLLLVAFIGMHGSHYMLRTKFR